MEFTVELFIMLILSLLTGLAIFLEIKDANELANLPNTDTLPPDKQKANLEMLACYPFFNLVDWRFIFLGSLIVGLILAFASFPKFTIHTFLLVFAVCFIIFFLLSTFQSFHVSRALCSKAQDGFTNF